MTTDETGSPEQLGVLIAGLSAADKAALTAGDDAWHLPALDHIGLGRLMMSDGPSGVRGAHFGTTRSLSYPCGMAVGATWDVELAARYGEALAEEATAKDVHLLLGPTVCIPRTPLAGRTFESFSEDPYLTARLTVAYVTAVQAGGVGCCVKHFACNDQEFERMTISADVDEVTLREVHLAPFEAAVTEAGVWAVMSAYNKINGTYCSEHPELLGTILKGEWGFDGVVVSDWTGTRSTIGAASAGLDIEMPAPPRFLGPKLLQAVESGDVDEAVLDDKAARILTLAQRTGLFDHPPTGHETEDDAPHRRSLARQIATAAQVLLTNDGTLPLDTRQLGSVALIGPNAQYPEARGGGSSTVTAFEEPGLLDALRATLDDTDVTYAPGCSLDVGLPPIPRWMLGGPMHVDYYAQGDFSGEPIGTSTIWGSRLITIGDPYPGVSLSDCAMRVRATLRPDQAGPWRLGITSTGPARVFLDGDEVIDNTEFERGRNLSRGCCRFFMLIEWLAC